MSIKSAYRELNQLSTKLVEDSNYHNKFNISIMSSLERQRLTELSEAFNDVIVNVVNFFNVDYLNFAQECLEGVTKVLDKKFVLEVENIVNMSEDYYACDVCLKSKQASGVLLTLEMLDVNTINKLKEDVLSPDLAINVDLRRQRGLTALMGEDESELCRYIRNITWKHINEKYDKAKRELLNDNLSVVSTDENKDENKIVQNKSIVSRKMKIKMIEVFEEATCEQSQLNMLIR